MRETALRAHGTVAISQPGLGIAFRKLVGDTRISRLPNIVRPSSYQLGYVRLAAAERDQMQLACMVPSDTRMYLLTAGQVVADGGTTLTEFTPAISGFTESRATLKRTIRAARTFMKVIEQNYPDELFVNEFHVPSLEHLLASRTLFVLDKPPSLDDREDGMSLHPGAFLRDYTFKDRHISPEDLKARGIADIDRLLAEQIEFDEEMRKALYPLIGSEADLMVNLQQLHNYEMRTGRKHSGRWLEVADGKFELAPE